MKWLFRETEPMEHDTLYSAARDKRPPQTGPEPGPAPAARTGNTSPEGSPGVVRAAHADRDLLPVGPGQEWLGERLLRGGGPGRHEELEGVLLRLVRPVQLHHRGQDARLAVGYGDIRADVLFQPLVGAGAAGIGGRGFGPAALRRGQALVRGSGGAHRWTGARA